MDVSLPSQQEGLSLSPTASPVIQIQQFDIKVNSGLAGDPALT